MADCLQESGVERGAHEEPSCSFASQIPGRSPLCPEHPTNQSSNASHGNHVTFHASALPVLDQLKETSRYAASCALQWYLADEDGPGEYRDGLLFGAGMAAMDAGLLDLARELMEQMIQRSSRSEHHCIYAFVLLVLEEGEPALAAALKSVELDPQFDEAWFRVGEVQRHLGRRAESLAAFKKAFELDPSLEMYVVEYAGAVAMEACRGVDCADFDRMKALLGAVAARNDNFWAMMYWADFCWMEDDREQTERAVRVAMKLDPYSRYPYWMLSLYFRDWGRPASEFDRLLDEALSRANELETANPVEAAFLRDVAAIIERRRDTRK